MVPGRVPWKGGYLLGRKDNMGREPETIYSLEGII